MRLGLIICANAQFTINACHLMKVKKKTQDLPILIGNILDHFDTSLYSFLAPILAPIFFPHYSPSVQLILAYSIPITSICTKPLGSVIFGIIAQVAGPVKGLSYSLIGLAITTALTGLLPSYQKIGLLAPIGLILLKGAASVFAAGENIIAKLYIMEDKEEAEEFNASYLYQTSCILGIVMSSLASAAAITAANKGYSEAWRVCFWFGGCVAFIGYFFRKSQLTVASAAIIKPNIYSYANLFWLSLLNHKANIFRIAVSTGFSYLTYSLPFIVMNSFIPLISQVTLENMMKLNSILLILDMLMIPLIGYLTRKLNNLRVMIIAASLLVISIIPLWYGLRDASLLYITFVRFWIVICGVVFLCPLNIWHKKLINAPEQYLLIGIGTSLGSVTIGYLTPAICLLLWQITGMSISIALYVVLIGAVTLYAIVSSK